MNAARIKDPTIAKLLNELHLDRRGWMIVDHWATDLMAIGIAKEGDPRRLVYVSTYAKKPGLYYYECEEPNGIEVSEYKTTEKGDDVDLTKLVNALERHLGG